MVTLLARRRFLLPLVLLCSSLCFAGQGNRVTAVAADQKPTPAKQTRIVPNGISSISHLLRRIRPHLGSVSIGTSYSRFSGPAVFPLYYSYIFPTWSYSGYAPLWNWSNWGPACCAFPAYPQSAIARRNGEGQVMLRVRPGTAEVLINNAYEGTVAGLKGNLWLKPGVYDLLIKAPGRAEFRRRIYVLSGKRLEITTRLAPANSVKNGNPMP